MGVCRATVYVGGHVGDISHDPMGHMTPRHSLCHQVDGGLQMMGIMVFDSTLHVVGVFWTV